MRARLLLWSCLGLNILLALMVVWLSRDTLNGHGNGAAVLETPAKETVVKTNVVVRRTGFYWNEIESADFPTYIANLRRIGCPEKTIRDIIIADVNELFAERMAREIQLPEQKWWLSGPDMDALQSTMDQVRLLEQEKAQLLAQLLGEGWDTQRTSNLTAGVVRFDGAVLSKLPPETKASVERIEANARRARTELAARAQAEGRMLDPAELTRLRRDKRRELALLLNQEQLEEYLLRYSDTAQEMRDELRGFSAGPDEFRQIFRARDGFEEQMAALDLSNPATAGHRAELERRRDAIIRKTLGPERFGLYQMSQNPLFREAQEQAVQNGAPAEKVLPIFRINQEAQAEIARIQADRNISEDQRRVALAMVQQQQQNSVERVLGNEPAEEIVQEAAPPVIQPPPLPPLPAETFGIPRSRGPRPAQFPPQRR